MNLELVSSCLTNVNPTTEMTFKSVVEAYEQAELFTSLGFEVEPPVSYDGETFTITIRQ